MGYGDHSDLHDHDERGYWYGRTDGQKPPPEIQRAMDEESEAHARDCRDPYHNRAGIEQRNMLNAAPDMLAALYAALPIVEDAVGDQHYKSEAIKGVLEKINAAIKKAESGQ